MNRVLFVFVFVSFKVLSFDLAAIKSDIADGNKLEVNAVLKTLEEEGAAGNTEAYLLIGAIYGYGLYGLPPQIGKTQKYLEPLLLSGDVEASYLLGTVLMESESDKDLASSISHLETAAKKGIQEQ
ncbi:hypothetical protein J8L98_17660 [Pseudoalteromonas sp. MMG013]|uniref:hypothetical protein n=1 Tax=Pseudoalteromonas sp. MMG013 TaxID=2822687 RepID=UPI001B3612B0|nr:hypothetical protein [Pseudoalteromonas sp. MMG013]MBQ4863512.1 hypothetical protein [Pseudoalteromonas sp. MMG013]